MAGNAPDGESREQGPGVKIARPFGIPVFVSPYWFLIAGVFVVYTPVAWTARSLRTCGTSWLPRSWCCFTVPCWYTN